MNFFKETWIRLKAESPTYFKILSKTSKVCAFILGIPAYVTGFGIDLPDALKSGSKILFWVAITAYGISKLTVKDPNTIK